MERKLWMEQIHPVSQRWRIRPRPQLFVTAILIASAFPIRFDVGLGHTASVFDITVIVCAVLFVFVLPVNGLARWPRWFLVLGLVSLVLSAASIGWSAAPTASILYTIATLEALAVFAMFITCLRDAPPRQIIRLTGLWLGMVLLGSFLLWAHVPGFLPPAGVDPTSGDYVSYFSRLSNPFLGRSNNIAALLCVFIIPFAVIAWRTRYRLAGMLAFIATAATVLTLSRGTFIALLGAIILYLLVDGKAGRAILIRAIFPAVLVLLILVIAVIVNPDIVDYATGRFSDAGFTSRSDLIYAAQTVFSQNWLLGTGAGTGVDFHNTFVQQFIYFGVLFGLIICTLLVGMVVSWFTVPRDEHAWLSKAIGAGVAAQVASFLIESSYEGTLLRPVIWMSWGLLVALVAAEKRYPQDLLRGGSSRRLLANELLLRHPQRPHENVWAEFDGVQKRPTRTGR